MTRKPELSQHLDRRTLGSGTHSTGRINEAGDGALELGALLLWGRMPPAGSKGRAVHSEREGWRRGGRAKGGEQE